MFVKFMAIEGGESQDRVGCFVVAFTDVRPLYLDERQCEVLERNVDPTGTSD